MLLCPLNAGDGFEHQHHSSVCPLSGLSSFLSFTHIVPPCAHSRYPHSHVRVLLAMKPCEPHREGAELRHSFICFGLGISQPSCKKAAAISHWNSGLTSSRAARATRGQRAEGIELKGVQGWHPQHSHPRSASFMPGADHAFIQDMGRA